MNSKETLKEAAREYYKRGQLGFEKAADTERAFLKGGLWQASRSYSKEELISAFEAGYDSARLHSSYKSNGTYQEDLNKFLKNFGK